MVRYPGHTGVRQATQQASGVARFATSVEATDSELIDVIIAPSTLQEVITENLEMDGQIRWQDTTLTSAQVKALATTPITLVAAPGAGKSILFVGAILKLNYGGTNAFTESDDNLGIKYTDASGVQVCTTIECTGFIDQTANTYTNAVPKADNIVAATGIENQALVLDNLNDNFTGNAANNNTLSVRVYYVVQTI